MEPAPRNTSTDCIGQGNVHDTSFTMTIWELHVILELKAWPQRWSSKASALTVGKEQALRGGNVIEHHGKTFLLSSRDRDES
ncbi:hypothetical protein OsI_36695 [Oryza sativa Indica Group]|uniref:Uncharacterized protein n=1 Tax=Oryza sativa subsp. indica TaxID=39946 RepID=A2ZFZ0_ORYSI|nr:hypothetical protein OsI_36695 [Oryza sativa Indica Group]